LSPTRIRFDFGGTVMASKLIDGTYPDYARVIPASRNSICITDRAEMADALDRVATILDRRQVTKLSFENGKLSLSAVNAEKGNADESIDVDFDAEATVVGFNPLYIRELLQSMDAERVRIEISSPALPAVFKAEGADEGLRICMPMRV
jgi:DNA polymerase-3 subunit beta